MDYEGSGIKIECTSKHPVLWTKKDGSIDSRHIINKWSLILINVTMNDSGMYYCHGTYTRKYRFKDSVMVHIGGK